MPLALSLGFQQPRLPVRKSAKAALALWAGGLGVRANAADFLMRKNVN
jgi:hypothetical protein